MAMDKETSKNNFDLALDVCDKFGLIVYEVAVVWVMAPNADVT